MAEQSKPRTSFIIFAFIGILVELVAFLLMASETITIRAALLLMLAGL